MRRLSLLAVSLVLPAVPLLAAVPAYAADNVICVGSPVGSCNQTAPTIQGAITIADGNAVPDTILVGPGTYSETPYVLDGNAHGLVLKGSGPATILTLPAGGIQDYVAANHATVQDLKIRLEPTTSGNDTGIYAFAGSSIQRVTVDGTGTTDALGIHVNGADVLDSSVVMGLSSGSTAMYGEGSSQISDTSLTGDTAFNHSGTGVADTLSRVTMRVGSTAGVTVDSGTVDVDNAVVDLGTGNGTGLRAANFNNSTSPKAVNATHVTIVGGGGSSTGVWAYAATPGAKQTSTVSLTSSVVRGPARSLVADAGNNGSQGGASVATVPVTYSDYQTTGGTIGANGTGGVQPGVGNLVGVDPRFANPAGGNYRLTVGSPVVDKGNPAAATATDRDRARRVIDGNGDNNAVPDMGAYELPDRIAPNTTITKRPPKRTTKRRVKFGFASSEPGSRFECRLDRRAWRTCTSPWTVRVKKGKHVVAFRARDGAGNLDATPATYRFRRV